MRRACIHTSKKIINKMVIMKKRHFVCRNCVGTPVRMRTRDTDAHMCCVVKGWLEGGESRDFDGDASGLVG